MRIAKPGAIGALLGAASAPRAAPW